MKGSKMQRFIQAMAVTAVISKAILVIVLIILAVKIVDNPYLIGEWFGQIVAGFEGVLE